VNKSLFARWRANFLTGLAVVLPGIVSVALLVWLFSTVAGITDTLLIFLPKTLTHQNHGEGPMYWYWSLLALMLATALVAVVGLLARNYFGKKMIEWIDTAMLRIPLLNKVYSATKQVNEAITSGNKSSFKTVVLVEFPRPGMHTLGFITSEQPQGLNANPAEKLVCVFVPTTPNPTGGFLVFVPEDNVTKLEMSAAEGIKYIVSLGSIPPEFMPPAGKVLNTSES